MKCQKLITTLWLLICLAVGAKAFAATLSSAKKLYSKKDFDQATIEYNELLMKRPNDERIHYGLGCAAYAKGDYQAAAESFQKALLVDDHMLESKALYNLGNAKYRIAKGKEQTDLSGSVEIMREALEIYKRSIDKDENNSDAKYNHEFVEKELKRMLDELKKQQDQQKSSSQQEQDKEQQSSQQQEQQQEAQSQPSESQQTQEEREKQGSQETQGTEEQESQDHQKQQEGEEDANSQKSAMQISKEEAENILDKFSMQESDEMLKPQEEIKRRTSVYKDW